MIYVILGTMGEYTKMFPVMQLFNQNKINYKFIHTCQHYEIIEKIRKKLGGRKPDYYLTLKKKDLANIWEFIFWAPKVLFNARKLPIKKNDFVIVHGDAESTLLGFIIGKFFRAKIVHVEAGFRSYNFLEPFPEEIVRTIVDRFANICFCAYKELTKNIKGKKVVIVTEENTILDTMRVALKIKPSSKIKDLRKKQYILFTLHRKENLMIKKRLSTILDILEIILKRGYLVIWPLHTNSVYELESKGLFDRIEQLKTKYNLQTNYFLDYVDFIHALKYCSFVVTDSGGLQTESYYLNKPSLILRKFMEIEKGIGETVYQSSLDMEKVNYFLDNLHKFKRTSKIKANPSQVVLDFFKNNI